MDAGYGTGSFSVVDGNGTTLASGGAFIDEDKAAFKTGNATTTSITEISKDEANDDKVFDMLGREVLEVPVGVMYIRNKKKYIKQ
jgi:hypothetical protein